MNEMKTIMIVDDEIDFQHLFSTILTSHNYKAIFASTGVECLKLAQLETPDLFILDVKMPEMDGYETIKHLRQIKKYKYTPMVFLTGYGTSPTAIESGYESGSTEYWTKPISREELLVRIRAVLKIAESEKQIRKLQQSFYSMIVHDLRNPIGAILGFTGLLLEEKESLTKDQFEMISAINDASVQSFQIVKDLLGLSQFESGEYLLSKNVIDLRNLIDEVIKKINILKNQKNIELQLQFNDLPLITADPDRLKIVLENIIDNALRFTSSGGTIVITTLMRSNKEHPNTQELLIEIKDNGAGISKEEIPLLFDKSRIMNPKFRKANTRTGLGLTICREIVEAHGGTINVDSTIGIGTTFFITLPQ